MSFYYWLFLGLLFVERLRLRSNSVFICCVSQEIQFELVVLSEQLNTRLRLNSV